VTNAQKHRIVLFIPNVSWLNERLLMSVPHSIAILSSILRDKFHVEIVDATANNLSPGQCKSMLQSIRPDAVLFSGLATFHHPKSIHYAIKIAKEACPDVVTVLGGIYPTIQPEVAARDKNVDFVFLGHAEERVSDFLEAVFKGDLGVLKKMPGIGFHEPVTGQFICNPVKTVIGQVKDQVKPDYTLMDLTPYLVTDSLIGPTKTVSSVLVAPILTSYGCPFECNFCATRTISGRLVAYRPLDDIFEEMDYFVSAYGVKVFKLSDDNLLLKRERIEAICKEFQGKRWGDDVCWKTGGLMAKLLDEQLLEMLAGSGCTEIVISVESGSERVHREIIKKRIVLGDVPRIVRKCKELGVLIRGTFVIGFPGERWDEIRQTFAFAEECDFDLCHFLIATPLPATELYEQARKSGVLTDDFTLIDPVISGFNTGFIETDEFTAQELAILRAFEWDRINFKTPEKTETIAKMYNMTPEQLRNHRKYTRSVLGHIR